jgi:hypothetical protein
MLYHPLLDITLNELNVDGGTCSYNACKMVVIMQINRLLMKGIFLSGDWVGTKKVEFSRRSQV